MLTCSGALEPTGVKRSLVSSALSKIASRVKELADIEQDLRQLATSAIRHSDWNTIAYLIGLRGTRAVELESFRPTSQQLKETHSTILSLEKDGPGFPL